VWRICTHTTATPWDPVVDGVNLNRLGATSRGRPAGGSGRGIALLHLAPTAPPEDRWRVDQQDLAHDRLARERHPRQITGAQKHVEIGVTNRVGLRDGGLAAAGVDALDNRLEQRLLAREVVVKRAAAHARRLEHSLDTAGRFAHPIDSPSHEPRSPLEEMRDANPHTGPIPRSGVRCRTVEPHRCSA
jgi:hypothetical protein